MYILQLLDAFFMIIIYKLQLYHMRFTIILCGYTVLTITLIITLFMLTSYRMRLGDTERNTCYTRGLEEPKTSDLIYIYDTFTLL